MCLLSFKQRTFRLAAAWLSITCAFACGSSRDDGKGDDEAPSPPPIIDPNAPEPNAPEQIDPDSVLPTPQPPADPNAPAEDTTPPESTAPVLTPEQQLGQDRLLRRIMLDWAGALPGLDTYEDFGESGLSAPEYYLDRLQSRSKHAQAMAQQHLRFWNMHGESLANTLNQLLSPNDFDSMSGRSRLLEEIVEHLTFKWTRKAGFTDLFQGEVSVAETSLSTSLGYSLIAADLGRPDLSLGLFPSTRPKAGLAATAAFHTLLERDRNPLQTSRRARFFSLLDCQNLQDDQAHTFEMADYTASSSLLLQASREQSPCRSCHGIFGESFDLFAGFAPTTARYTDSTFIPQSQAQWAAYTPQTNAGSPDALNLYAGTSYATLSQLTAELAGDAQWAQCQIQQLYGSLQHSGSFDSLHARETLALARGLERRQGDFLALVSELIKDPFYAAAPSAPSSQTDWPFFTTGLRVLTKHQWVQIFQDLAPEVDYDALTQNLQSSERMQEVYSWAMPDIVYLDSLDRLVRAVAIELTQRELSPGQRADQRKLLTALADDTGLTSTPTQIDTQIQQLWRRFSSENLPADHPRIGALRGLYSQAKTTVDPNITAEQLEQIAWQTVLIGVWLSPPVVTY